MPRVTINPRGQLLFRHTLVFDGKYGKTICKGVAKLTGKEQGTVKDELELLLDLKPRKREDAPKGLHPATIEIWFKPIEADRKRSFLQPPHDSRKDDILSRPEGTLSQKELLEAERWHRQDAEERADAAEAKARETEKALSDMAQKLGRLELKNEGITLQECVSHFEKFVTCESLNAKHELMRRVRHVVDAIGPMKAHSAVSKKMIVDAVDAEPASETEAMYRRRDIKRFFRLLSAPVSSDGLGLANPAAMLKVGSTSKLQRKRRAAGDIEILDPRSLLSDERLPLYWKALVALLGFAGLRLKEAAALEWSRVGGANGLVNVRPTKHYPKLKSILSERDVKPFPNLWDTLDKYKKEARHESLVFDRVGRSGPTWFRMYRGEPTAADLSGALIDAIGAALGMHYTLKNGQVLIVKVAREKTIKHPDGSKTSTLYLQLMNGKRVSIDKAELAHSERPPEPARRLRRFWETTMRQFGLGDLIEPMGGHTEQVGQAHYTKYESIVESAKIPRL